MKFNKIYELPVFNQLYTREGESPLENLWNKRRDASFNYFRVSVLSEYGV